MRIGILNWRDMKHPQAGGAELYLHEQAKIWAKKGNKVIWLTSSVKNRPKIESLEGIKFIRAGNQMSVYLTSIINYFKYLRDCDVLIDAENGIPFFTPLFSNKRKILLIHHIHKDVWFKEQKFPISWIGYILENKIMPLVYKNTEIVTVSNSSKEEIRKLFPKNKIKIIYNAIPKSFHPGNKSKKPSIIFVGRLKRYKSIDILLKATAIVDKNLEINIIGRGDDERRLKDIAKKLNLTNTNFLGFVSDKDKLRLLQKSWIAVNPSFVEGWSITNIEANASGTPVIGSNVQGIRDSIIDNKTGMLFKYGDEKELASKIKLLLKDSKLRKELSNSALEWSRRFSWEKSAEDFLDLLKK